MSASPAGNMSSQNAGGGGKQPIRRLAAPKANPLVSRKPKQKPGTVRLPNPNSVSKLGGPLASRPVGTNKPQAQNAKKPGKPAEPLTLEDRPFGDTTPSMFEKPPPAGTYKDYGLYTTKKALLEGLRLHVARLTSHRKVDLRDQTQFTPPLYLLRRDIRTPITGVKDEDAIKAEQEGRPEPTEEDVEREAAKAAARAEIAPSQGSTKPRQKQPQKKTQQVFMKEQTAEQKYRSQLKYEEALPWHLEDDEHKQVWMGTYEEMSSNTWAQIRFENRGDEVAAVMTPLEKWYKFTPKARVDAEVMRQHEEQQLARIKKEDSAEPEFMKAFERAIKKEEQEREDYQAARGRMYISKGQTDGIGRKNEEELDFEEDWADDEAPPEIEGEEEDIKDIQKRIKKDQLKSNVFNMVGDAEYEQEDVLEKKEKERLRKEGRKTAKALVKREHNAIYESDEEDEYAEKSDSTDTEEEILREKEKKEAEAKAAGTGAAAATNNKPGSATSSRNNTPGHRASKHPEPLAKTAIAAGLKRPGSPNLSDASGNESSTARKKQKKVKLPGSKLVPSSQPPSRSRSPANGPRPAVAPRGSFAGSGSDTDTSAPNKLLARKALAGVRSPSPANGGTPGTSRIGSRAGSPETTTTTTTAAVNASAVNALASAQQKFRHVPSNEVLKSLIPPEGLMISSLGKLFEISAEERKELIARFKAVSSYDKATKMLKPLKP